jgi:GxxExxY protein
MALAPHPELNALTSRIIGFAIEIHRILGPGLLESVYQACLFYELQKSGLQVDTQKTVPVVYKDVKLDIGFRADAIVERTVIVEIKSVVAVAPIHRAQVLTYLKLTGCQAGLLINFNVPVLKQGITRVLSK